ncbi:hypothetical protein ACFSTC_02955 [Nonomuraea ferruginea]
MPGNQSFVDELRQRLRRSRGGSRSRRSGCCSPWSAAPTRSWPTAA